MNFASIFGGPSGNRDASPARASETGQLELLVSRFFWRVQSKDPLGANAAEKGDRSLQKRRQRSQDIELLR
jgi:hypothetical protein